MTTISIRDKSRPQVEDEELDMRWESFLNGKRDDVKRRLGLSFTRQATRHDETREEPVQNIGDDEVREGVAPAPVQETPKRVSRTPIVDLMRMVERRDWAGIVAHVTRTPQAAFARMTNTKGTAISSQGNLLLHEVCKNDPSLEVVEALLAMNTSAIKVRGEFGRLPLHFACSSGADTEIILKLVERFPEGTKQRDANDLMLPLHLACKWGTSSEAMKALVGANPEGRSTRDIYAKTPVDYAKELPSPDMRSVAMQCLEGEMRQVSLQERAAIFNNNNKLDTIQQENDKLQQQNKRALELQLAQEQKLKQYEKEHEAMKALHQTSEEKKHLLEKKLIVLIKASEVKQELIEKLERENNVNYKVELTKALQEQEEKYSNLLKQEQQRGAQLERQANEVEITHRLYTNAILEEHDREAANFEAFTLQFKELEIQLRDQLDETIAQKEYLEEQLSGKYTDFEDVVTAEKEKVSFLEGHVEKVNSLLETEQRRFQDLEEILKQTIAVENDQREEVLLESKRKEEEFQRVIAAERRKLATLQEDYIEVQKLLQSELDKASTQQSNETDLEHTIKGERRKLQELRHAYQESQKLLKLEKAKVAHLQASQSEAQNQLLAEQQESKILKQSALKMSAELEDERKTVAELKQTCAKKQADYESEKKKVKAMQKTQAGKRQVLDSLQHKVAVLEGALAESEDMVMKEGAKLEASEQELSETRSFLQKEQQRIEELLHAQEKLHSLLDSEKKKVKNLEQAQVCQEAVLQEGEGDADYSKLIENQKLLNIERARVANLQEELAQVNEMLESEGSRYESLQEKLQEKEEMLQRETEKVRSLEEAHEETKAQLESEHKRVGDVERQLLEALHHLEAEQRNVLALEKSLAAVQTEVEQIRLNAAESETDKGLDPVDSRKQQEELESVRKHYERSLKQAATKIFNLEKDLQQHKDLISDDISDQGDLGDAVEKLKVQLDAEQELVQQLELELSEAKALCNAHRRRAAQLTEGNSKHETELNNEKKLVASLEQDQVRQNVLIESEQNKVKALEHSKDQLSALLEWEKKNLKTHLDKHAGVEKKLEDAEKQITATLAALEEKTVTVDQLTEQLESLGDLRKQVIRLNAEARQRDVLVASLLRSIGDNKKLSTERHVEEARIHVDDLHRIVGLDLAGLDDSVITERALVPMSSRDISTYRNIRRTLAWSIPLIPLVAISRDPSLLQEITSRMDPAMLGDLRDNFATITANMDPAMLREFSFSSSTVQEPILQLFGLASQMATNAMS